METMKDKRMSDETPTIQAYYQVYTPSLRERFWRWAGFRYHLGDDPPDIEALPGWMKTDIRIHFSIADRLRLLLTGRLFIASVVHTDTPSAAVCKSRVDWKIDAPGDDFSP
jgi:hypothetical protein